MPHPPHIIEHLSTHRSTRHGNAVLAIVLHGTVGTDSLDYLTKNVRQVSSHYLIARGGVIYRMVPETQTANHAGFGTWTHAGVTYRPSRDAYVADRPPNVNWVTVGIELESLQRGRADDYTGLQLDAMGWLIADIRTRHGPVPILRHADLDPTRRSDPIGLGVQAIEARVPALPIPPPTPPFAAYTADSAILGPSHATPGQATDYILARSHANYEDDAITDTIVPTYYEVCRGVGVDAVLVIAQMIHETGNLTSFWSARGPQYEAQRRNPAGVGVTGETRKRKPDGATDWAYNRHTRLWEAGESFASWKDHAIPAHVGRLLAYAVPAGAGTPEQRVLIQRALTVRHLPPVCRGSAAILRHLGKAQNPEGDAGCGWAGKDTTEGGTYGAKIAAIANAICAVPL